MDDVLRMQVVYRKSNLKDKLLNFCFGHHHAVLILDVDVKVTLITVLEENAENLLVREAIFKPTNVWMSQVSN